MRIFTFELDQARSFQPVESLVTEGGREFTQLHAITKAKQAQHEWKATRCSAQAVVQQRDSQDFRHRLRDLDQGRDSFWPQLELGEKVTQSVPRFGSDSHEPFQAR